MSTPTSSDSIALRDMWRALVRGSWQTLAVVPAEAGASAAAVGRVFSGLADAAGAGRFELVAAEGASAGDGTRLATAFGAPTSPGVRRVATVDPLVVSLSGIPLAMAADAVLLVVRLDAPEPASVQSTLGILGAERVLGYVAVGAPRPA